MFQNGSSGTAHLTLTRGPLWEWKELCWSNTVWSNWGTDSTTCYCCNQQWVNRLNCETAHSHQQLIDSHSSKLTVCTVLLGPSSSDKFCDTSLFAQNSLLLCIHKQDFGKPALADMRYLTPSTGVHPILQQQRTTHHWQELRCAHTAPPQLPKECLSRTAQGFPKLTLFGTALFSPWCLNFPTYEGDRSSCQTQGQMLLKALEDAQTLQWISTFHVP